MRQRRERRAVARPGQKETGRGFHPGRHHLTLNWNLDVYTSLKNLSSEGGVPWPLRFGIAFTSVFAAVA
jgi:hypothetical protein